MNPEVEFILDALASVVDAQPAEHPLRRVDRDNALVYEGSSTVDMTEPIHTRKGELEQSNLVGVASQSRENSPLGTDYDVETDIVLSVRVEGLRYDEWGHVDPDGSEGVVFDTLYNDIREAIYAERTYPQHPDFRDGKMELQLTNEDIQDSEFADYYRREFDVVFRGKEELP